MRVSLRYLRPEGDRSRLMTRGAAYQRYPVAVHRNVPAYAEGRAFSPRALLCLRSARCLELCIRNLLFLSCVDRSVLR